MNGPPPKITSSNEGPYLTIMSNPLLLKYS